MLSWKPDAKITVPFWSELRKGSHTHCKAVKTEPPTKHMQKLENYRKNEKDNI